MNSIKTLLSTIVLLLVFQQAHSKQFFIQARAGAGTSGKNNQREIYTSYKSVVSGGANIFAGISVKNFNIGIGVSLISSGFKYEGLLFEDAFDPTTGLSTIERRTTDVFIYYRDIIIPVTLSYTLLPGKKVSIAPELGFGPSIRTISHSKMVSSDGTTEKTDPIGTSSPMPLFGQVAVNVVYNINKHVGISFTPMYMRNLFNITGNSMRMSGTYALTGNIGVLVKL